MHSTIILSSEIHQQTYAHLDDSTSTSQVPVMMNNAVHVLVSQHKINVSATTMRITCIVIWATIRSELKAPTLVGM